MTYSNSSLATEKVNFGTKNSNKRDQYYPDTKRIYNPTGVITKISIHHMAGKMTAKSCAQMHYKSSGSSANYYIGYNGEICSGVDESRRAWTSGDRECDSFAITIEVSNDINKAPWTVSDKSYDSLIKLCADICKRNNIQQIEFTGDKSGNLVMHRWYQNTYCPGDYLANRFPDIARKVNDLLKSETVTQNTTTPTTSNVLYAVQVGAFANKSNADRLCEELRGKGYSPIIVSKQK